VCCSGGQNGCVDVDLSHEFRPFGFGVEEVVHYTYVSSPTQEYIIPERGPSRGGTALHMHGQKFTNTHDLSCKFGNMHVRATFVSEQEILCLTPSHAQGCVALDVAINGRDLSGNFREFKFLS